MVNLKSSKHLLFTIVWGIKKNIVLAENKYYGIIYYAHTCGLYYNDFTAYIQCILLLYKYIIALDVIAGPSSLSNLVSRQIGNKIDQFFNVGTFFYIVHDK